MQNLVFSNFSLLQPPPHTVAHPFVHCMRGSGLNYHLKNVIASCSLPSALLIVQCILLPASPAFACGVFEKGQFFLYLVQ